MFNILLSIFVCAAASLFFAWVVRAHVSAPYVIAGSTHGLKICLFKYVPMLPSKMSRCLANAVHPAASLPGLVFVSGAVSLSQVDGGFDVLDLSVVDILVCVSFHHHLCLRLVHLQTPIVTFIS